ncbi:hypothetical protein [Hyphococcus sp.]|uniref:hypothetical protein n=1 Tax=Hyphococcus sp. TaxID=2038636 RepID=UPI003CCC0C00
MHYAKVTKAANETQADCMRMIVRAEMRMADEIDKGQADGALAKQRQRSNVRGADVSEMDEIGVSRQRVAEWREVRDAGAENVERVIRRAVDYTAAKVGAFFWTDSVFLITTPHFRSAISRADFEQVGSAVLAW